MGVDLDSRHSWGRKEVSVTNLTLQKKSSGFCGKKYRFVTVQGIEAEIPQASRRDGGIGEESPVSGTLHRKCVQIFKKSL
jgi:hypothetical protein